MLQEIADLEKAGVGIGYQQYDSAQQELAQLNQEIKDYGNDIGKVKENPRMHIPIIGNGDITSPQKAKDAFDRYGVDGIMIGRATTGIRGYSRK